MTTHIPSKYKKYVHDASVALGIPEQLIAEQINLESSWNPHAKSGAGAEGIAQFEPGTFAHYGPKGGSPYSVKDSFAAYTAYMSALLKQEHGSIRNALAAYNAGPGNLSAGYTYANMIMQRAGVVPGAKAGKAGRNAAHHGGDVIGAAEDAIGAAEDAAGGLLSWPGDIVDFFKGAAGALESTASFFGAFFQPSTYVRIGAGVAGFLLIIVGIVALGMSIKE